nr:MAG TPA: hypothetical protein [Caudoviricetes sp.]
MKGNPRLNTRWIITNDFTHQIFDTYIIPNIVSEVTI